MQQKEKMVLTVFRAGNFDMIVENATDSSSGHTTHVGAFQEHIHVLVPKTKSRKINVNEVPVAVRFNDAKKEPPKFNNTSHILVH